MLPPPPSSLPPLLSVACSAESAAFSRSRRWLLNACLRLSGGVEVVQSANGFHPSGGASCTMPSLFAQALRNLRLAHSATLSMSWLGPPSARQRPASSG